MGQVHRVAVDLKLGASGPEIGVSGRLHSAGRPGQMPKTTSSTTASDRLTPTLFSFSVFELHMEIFDGSTNAERSGCSFEQVLDSHRIAGIVTTVHPKNDARIRGIDGVGQQAASPCMLVLQPHGEKLSQK